MSVDDLLAKAHAQYDMLEYNVVLVFTEAVLARADLTLAQKLDAYAMQGSALAIIADAIDAEKPFRLLLRADPDFDLPDSTPPKIIAVFRKVQVEERAIRDEVRKIERIRVVETLKITGDPPLEARGGRSIPFRYRLRDPQGAVDSFRVHYRREGDPDFISLPLKRDDEGNHTGRIPGEWTAGQGFTLQFYVAAADDEGILVSQGTPKEPLSIPVAAGEVDKNAYPVPIWGFLTAAGASATAGVVASALTGATLLIQDDYNRRVASASSAAPVDGASLVRQAELGNSVMVAQWIAWGAAGLGAVVTGVLAPFTNWSGQAPEEETTSEPPAKAEGTPVAWK